MGWWSDYKVFRNTTHGDYKYNKKRDLQALVCKAYGDPRKEQDKGEIRDLRFKLECHGMHPRCHIGQKEKCVVVRECIHLNAMNESAGGSPHMIIETGDHCSGYRE